MSLAQTTEILSMLALGALLHRFRLKWILACGLAIGVIRFALCALPFKAALLAGTTLHGACYAWSISRPRFTSSSAWTLAGARGAGVCST